MAKGKSVVFSTRSDNILQASRMVFGSNRSQTIEAALELYQAKHQVLEKASEILTQRYEEKPLDAVRR